MREDRGALTGRFTYDVPTDEWEWDAEVYRIHGLIPGEVRPTTKQVLSAAAAGDADRVRELLEKMIATTESFSVSYRLNGADDRERTVVLVGESALCDPEK